MTGAEFKLKFETLIDELYSGYWDAADINRFAQTAVNRVTTDILKDFETNNIDTARLLPLLNNLTVASPVSNVIDISRTSTEVPNCKQVLLITPVFASDSATVRTTRQLYGDIGAIYSTGTVRYPKYILSSGSIDIYPKTPAVSSCRVYFVREPFYVDVADAATVIPYNDEMIELIIGQTIVEASRSAREYSMSNITANAVNSEIK
jgi:hypothetical protein